MNGTSDNVIYEQAVMKTPHSSKSQVWAAVLACGTCRRGMICSVTKVLVISVLCIVTLGGEISSACVGCALAVDLQVTCTKFG